MKTAQNPLTDLLSRIDDLRCHMVAAGRLHGLGSAEVLHHSTELDKLIFQAQLLKIDKRLSS